MSAEDRGSGRLEAESVAGTAGAVPRPSTTVSKGSNGEVVSTGGQPGEAPPQLGLPPAQAALPQLGLPSQLQQALQPPGGAPQGSDNTLPTKPAVSDGDIQPGRLPDGTLCVPVVMGVIKGMYHIQARLWVVGVIALRPGEAVPASSRLLAGTAWRLGSWEPSREGSRSRSPHLCPLQPNKVAYAGELVTPTQFEAAGGRVTSRKWRLSIR